MYRKAYQRGMLTIFFSGGSKPLEIWETKTRDGYIKRFLDPEIKTMVLEIRGNNISTAYMSCPKGNQVLGITMPFLVMVVKNLMKYFSFEVTVLDSTGTRRRFRVSNFQSTTQILPLCTVMPIGLATGWNQIQFNLAEFTRRAYKNQFVEVQKLKINANIRIRRIYFTEKLLSDDELPVEYKLYFPLQQKGPKSKERETDKENIISTIKEDTEGQKLDIIVSATSFKKFGKSSQTEGEQEVKADPTIVGTAAKEPPEREEQPKDIIPNEEMQKVTSEKETVAATQIGDEKIADKAEDKKSSGEAEETKGDETTDNDEHEDKTAEEMRAKDVDKGEVDKNLAEVADKGVGDTKSNEEVEKVGGETKPDEEPDKGEGDNKSGEKVEATN